MPSVNSRSMPNVWPSSTLTTPSSDLVDRVGDHVADLVVAGGDRRHAGDLILAGDLLGLRGDVRHDLVDSALDAALERQRVGAGSDVLQTLANDRLGEHGRRGG